MRVTSKQVLGSRFRVTRLREGYDQHAVDAFMDQVAVTLAQYEGHPSPADVLGGVPSPSDRPPLCPTDGGQLVDRSLDELRYSRCPDCGGVWLDRNALVALMAGADIRTHSPSLGSTSSWIAGLFRA